MIGTIVTSCYAVDAAILMYLSSNFRKTPKVNYNKRGLGL
jgi:hypothetical protein